MILHVRRSLHDRHPPRGDQDGPGDPGVPGRSWARCRVLLTAQHRELVDPMLGFFGIEPDIDLDIMRPDQSLVELTTRLLPAVHDAIAASSPTIVLAQGDTTTVLATALASFYHKVPFAHVEAGLRTHRLFAPFPEEANRVLAGHLSALHFAPTAGGPGEPDPGGDQPTSDPSSPATP